jgi:hypothetical protein
LAIDFQGFAFLARAFYSTRWKNFPKSAMEVGENQSRRGDELGRNTAFGCIICAISVISGQLSRRRRLYLFVSISRMRRDRCVHLPHEAGQVVAYFSPQAICIICAISVIRGLLLAEGIFSHAEKRSFGVILPSAVLFVPLV